MQAGATLPSERLQLKMGDNRSIARSTNWYNCIGKKTLEVTFEDKDPGAQNCTPCYRPCKHVHICTKKTHTRKFLTTLLVIIQYRNQPKRLTMVADATVTEYHTTMKMNELKWQLMTWLNLTNIQLKERT